MERDIIKIKQAPDAENIDNFWDGLMFGGLFPLWLMLLAITESNEMNMKVTSTGAKFGLVIAAMLWLSQCGQG